MLFLFSLFDDDDEDELFVVAVDDSEDDGKDGAPSSGISLIKIDLR